MMFLDDAEFRLASGMAETASAFITASLANSASMRLAIHAHLSHSASAPHSSIFATALPAFLFLVTIASHTM